MTPVELQQGSVPIVLGMPHTGEYVPDDIWARLNSTGQQLADTDWNIHKLYEDLLPGASIVRATFHRYVIDANRAPSGDSLYPGKNTTGLCPLTDFDGQPLYCEGCEPDKEEIERRRINYHAPYHNALANELERVRQQHGVVVLYDCHSIRSELPFLFDGVLPDLNIGTNNGKTCSKEFELAVNKVCQQADGYTAVLNGRFKGGWTTRYYGQPDKNMHAIQMELAQSTYMDEAAPWQFLPERAERIRSHLKTILETLNKLALSQV